MSHDLIVYQTPEVKMYEIGPCTFYEYLSLLSLASSGSNRNAGLLNLINGSLRLLLGMCIPGHGILGSRAR